MTFKTHLSGFARNIPRVLWARHSNSNPDRTKLQTILHEIQTLSYEKLNLFLKLNFPTQLRRPTFKPNSNLVFDGTLAGKPKN